VWLLASHAHAQQMTKEENTLGKSVLANNGQNICSARFTESNVPDWILFCCQMQLFSSCHDTAPIGNSLALLIIST